MSFPAAILSQLPGIEHDFAAVDAPRPASLFFCAQAHTATVIEIDERQPAGVIEADAVFTRSRRPIAVITADCLPLLVASADGALVAAIHGGWQGLQRGIIGHTLQRLEAEGVSRQQLRIAIGPAIKPCCYEVSPGFIATLEATQGHLWQGTQPPWFDAQPQPQRAPAIAPPPPTQAGSLWFDLNRYALLQLHAEGVASEQVAVSPSCTYCSTQALASYRRRNHRGDAKAFQYSWIQRA